MNEHSNIMGGSTAEQRIHCPGSLKLEEGMPDEESEYAREGSMLHAAMELALVDGMHPEQLDKFIGANLGFDGLEITREHVEMKLKPALRAWTTLVDKYRIDDWFIEQRVSLEAVIPGAFGTIDVLAKDKAGRLHVLDWKFGDGIFVEVEGSYQLGFYAACALYDEDEEIREFCEDVTDIVLHVVQPRKGDDEDVILRSWETTDQWVEALIDQAERAVKLAQTDNPPIKPGKWCRFCAAEPKCPARAAMAADALSRNPESMTAVELADALDKADQLKSWMRKVFELAEKESVSGTTIPGWKLVEKRAQRVFTDKAAVIRILKGRKWKNDRIYKPRELKSPAQLEAEDKELYNKSLAQYVEKKSSGLTLVRDSDKRPAVADPMALLANALENAGVNP